MSKSAENDGSRINLLDTPDTIAKKIKRCKVRAFLSIYICMCVSTGRSFRFRGASAPTTKVSVPVHTHTCTPHTRTPAIRPPNPHTPAPTHTLPTTRQTDAFEGLEWDNPERPECTNLLNIYQSVTGKTREVCLSFF